MALNLTKVAYGVESVEWLRQRLEHAAESGDGPFRMITRYLPKRHAEMVGGSLYWIHQHMLVGRSPLVGFAPREDGKQWILLEPRLIPVMPQARRAHQGWRYLAGEDAPADLSEDEATGDVIPSHLLGQLAKIGLF